MEYDWRIATVLLAVFIFLLLLNAFRITPLSIQDTDASTYVIVPMIMLPVFALIMLKLRVVPNVGRNDLVIGAAFFAVFLVASLLLQLYFSFMFVGFRLDLLLFPLAIAAMVTVLFGFKNLGRFKALMVYALLASPLVLLPIISLAGGFTVFNTIIVYSILKIFISSASYVRPISIVANGYNIGIGQTCVSIGAFIGLVLFLIPLAYLYAGKARNKIYWVVAGVVLLFLLNLIRMGSITYVWLAYGPSRVISYIHVFIGQLLFYAAIVVMILVSGAFGIGFARRRKERTQLRRSTEKNLGGISLAVVFTILYLGLSSTYLYNTGLSASTLARNVPLNLTNPEMQTFLVRMESIPSYNITTFGSSNGKEAAMAYSNASVTQKAPIVFYVGAFGPNTTRELLRNNTLLGELTFLSYRGTLAHVYSIESNNTDFYLYYTTFPYVLSNGSFTDMGVYGIMEGYVAGQSHPCADYASAYTTLINLLNPAAYSPNMRNGITSAYCIDERLVWYNES